MTDFFPDAETVLKQAESAAAELRSVRLGSVRATIEAAVKRGRFCTTTIPKWPFANVMTEEPNQ